MANIDLLTTQKVSIQYEIAGLRDRAIAFVLDFFIVLFLLGFLAVGMTMLELYGVYEYIFFVILIPIRVFYTLFSELFFNGQTIGKRAIGIKIMKINGKELDFTDHFVRWAFRMIDIWFSAGSIAATLVSSSQNGQRLGDLATGTAVIKLRSSLQFQLSEILNISTLENYEPVYPSVNMLTEADMILIKNALTRYDRYGNKAHQFALVETVQHLCQVLQIRYESVLDQRIFLRTLIKDYIVLTR